MPTVSVNLDTTQYVQVNSSLGQIILQSHRDDVRIAISALKPAKSNTAYHQLAGKDAPLQLNAIDTNVWALAITDRSALTVSEINSPTTVGGGLIQDPALAVALGLVPGIESHHIHGINNSTILPYIPEHIWGVGGTIPSPTTAVITSLHTQGFGSGGDPDAIGNRVLVEGVDVNWNYVEQTKALHAVDSKTKVTLDTPLLRINHMELLDGAITVDLSVVATETTLNTVHSLILPGDTATIICSYSVPVDKIALVTFFSCGMATSLDYSPETSVFELYKTRNDGTTTVSEVLEVIQLGYRDGGDSVPFESYIPVPERHDIRPTVFLLDEQGYLASASFDIIVVDI